MSLAYRANIRETTHDEAARALSALLVVDESDPVMFDHSIDHVPGMLMLHGLAELVELAETGHAAATFDLVFTRFVEKDLPTRIAIRPETARGWRVEVTQSGDVVCAGTAECVPLDGHEPAAAGPAPAAAAPGLLAAGALVHRYRPEGVVVSPLRAVGGRYAVDYAPSEFVRTKRFEEWHHPLDIVEATRQFMAMLSHTVCGTDLSTRMILTRLVVRMPRLFPRTTPVRLRAERPRVDRSRLEFPIRAHCGDAPAVTADWYITAVTPAAYARLRGKPHG